MLTLTFLKPPPINHIYAYTSRGGKARSYVTKEGREWFEACHNSIFKQMDHFETAKKPVSVCIYLYTCRHQDSDGVIKPIYDMLQHEEIILDDVLIYEGYQRKIKVHHLKDEKVVVTIKFFNGGNNAQVFSVGKAG